MEVVKQEGIKDCGVCSLLSIVKYYGGDVSLEYLREITNTAKNGVSAYNLVKAATSLGFNSYGLSGKIEDIKDDMLPIISHVIVSKSYQHFIVIYKKNDYNKKLAIMDPAIGKKTISYAEFNLMTSENYIYLKPIKKILKLERKNIINELLYEFITKNKKYIPHIILLATIYFILNISTAFYLKLLLNKAINYSIIENVYMISKIIIIIYIFKEVTNYIKNIIAIKWSSLLDEELTRKILKRLTLLPYLYYKNRTSGEIISRIKDLSVIKNFLIKLYSSLFLDLAVIMVFIILLIRISLNLALLTIITSIILLIEEIIINKMYLKRKERYLRKEDKINGLLYEYINTMPTIKSLHIEKEKINSFFKDYSNFIDKAYIVNKTLNTNVLFNNTITNFFTIILYTTGSILIINDKLSIGNLIVFESILNIYLRSINNLLELYKNYNEYKLSKKRIEDLFTINIENFNCLEYFKDYKLIGTIKIKNLYYSYGTKIIFSGLNLIIKQDEKIFLTGKSGSGKSTLMKILTRFIPISYGNIEINNIDLNHYHLDTIRNRIIYVSQNESLFTGSIKENILFESDDNKLDEVASITKVDKLLDKNLGYQKIIEENGNNMSGGERQKIILARSIIKDADIYIFDEALNQIDIEQEKEILTKIIKYLNNKVVIVISHRMTCLDLFDRVLTLENGVINEKI